MAKVTPFLWFDKQAEEAINFYTSIFKNSKIISITRYPEDVPEGPMKGMEGLVLTGIFELDGQRFMALDGGPQFKFNESVSFSIDCDSQAEVDYYWDKLSAVPEAEQCGWLKDKYGLSWQVIPHQLNDLMSDPDPAKSKRITAAMLKMKKIVIADLQAARDSDKESKD